MLNDFLDRPIHVGDICVTQIMRYAGFVIVEVLKLTEKRAQVIYRSQQGHIDPLGKKTMKNPKDLYVIRKGDAYA